MIKLSAEEYYLSGVSEEFFWEELDGITAGQTTNPEFSYSTQYFAKFENVFGGRKVDNQFSIYLYNPINRPFRTEILSKGIVSKTENGLKIKCNYEIPFFSLLMFVMIGGVVFIPLFILSITIALVCCGILTGLYLIVVQSNLINVKEEIKTQFVKIKNKGTK